MTVSVASATYRILVSEAGVSVMGTPALTLTQADLTETPILSGPSVDVLKCTTVSHPFRIRCKEDTDAVLFHSGGRMTALGRLCEVQRDTGAGFVTVGTGRISHYSEAERGLVDVEVSDERWTERRTEIFRTTDTMQLHPPGLAAAWRDRLAAGTATYVVDEVDGNAVRLTTISNEGVQGTQPDYVARVPASLMFALASDLSRTPTPSASNSAGNFASLRFRTGGADKTVISFHPFLTAGIIDPTLPTGILGSLSPFGGSGELYVAWVYMGAGHGLSATDPVVGRFYWPLGVPTSPGVPVHIGGVAGVHPMQLLKDVLDGDYGGDPVNYDSTAMTALLALSTPNVWARITKSSERATWLERSIYRPYAVAPLVGTDLVVRPTALRAPSDENPDSYTVLDASNADVPTWEHTSRDLATVVAFKSRVVAYRVDSATPREDWPADDIEVHTFEAPDIEHDTVATLGRVVHEIDTDLIIPSAYPDPDVQEVLGVELFNVFGDGPQRGFISVPDDAGVQVGEFVSLDHDTLKGFNVGTGDRTGNRLVRLIGFPELHPDHTVFEYLDLGPHSQQLDPPTVSIAEASDLDYVEVTISGLNAGETAIVEVEKGTSPPSTFSLQRANVGNETVSFRLKGSGGNAYARARATMPGRIASAWASDSVALTTRARVDSADLIRTGTTAEVLWTVPSGTLGMRTDYVIHSRAEVPVFGSNVQDYDVDDGGFTISGLVSTRDAVSVQLTPYPGWTGSAVSGTAGDTVTLTQLRPRVFPGSISIAIIRPGLRTTFNDDNEAVVSVSGDDNTARIIVTVGDGSSPADPTLAANDGEISGQSGTVETGVPITVGNDAYVRAAAVTSAGTVGPVVGSRERLPVVRVPSVAMAVAQSGTTGSLDLEIHDPALAVTNVQFAKKTDAGSYGSLATTWDRSTGTIGASVDLTRGEDITLTSKHAVSIRWVVTYTDDAGGSRTLEGAHSFDSDLIAEVTNIGVAFNANGEAVVSATGDEDTADLYVTVSDGSAPADPTAGTNDGSISGRTGSVDTGVKITTGSEAFVRVVAADSGGTPGPVVQTRQERRIGPFAKDTTDRAHSGNGTETTVETLTIPANKLGTNGGVRLTGWVQTSGLSGVLAVRIKLGGSAVASLFFTGTSGGMSFVTVLFNDGATDAQDSLTNWLVTGGSAEVEIDRGVGAIDSTSDMDITITVQLGFGGGGTAGSATLRLTYLEFLGTD